MTEADTLQRAVELLCAGELVAIPTETVYGLGADAANPEAVAKIFAAKGRPADHPLIVHVPDASHLGRWARDVPPAAHELANAFWPGPLTLILKRGANVPDLVTGGQDSIGLRVPGHPLALELLRAFAAAGGSGIAAPSANRFGRISPTTAEHVREELGSAVALVLEGGPCQVGIESTIVDLTRDAPVMLRPGVITAEAIEAVLSARVSASTGAQPAPGAPRVSGSLAAHYAPHTAMRLVAGDGLADAITQQVGLGKQVAVLAMMPDPGLQGVVVWHQAPDGAAAYAHALYASLRAMDQSGADILLVQAPPRAPEWMAIWDRLSRAECGAGE
jgi:L-threonylcarbamoyladenylate synthase